LSELLDDLQDGDRQKFLPGLLDDLWNRDWRWKCVFHKCYSPRNQIDLP
jgi:hypothetical protein